MHYLTRVQINNSLSASAKRKDKYYMIILVFSQTGLRVAELVALTPQNINFDASYIAIKGKGGKIRNVDIAAQLAMQLQLFIKNHNIAANKPIFKITDRRVRQIIAEFCNSHPHALRHSYAIELLRKTGNVRYVQKQLGHSSLATTQIYLQFYEYEQEKSKLTSLFAGDQK